MPKAPPELIQPDRLAERGATLAGSAPIADMPRLAEMLHTADATARFELRFERDDAGRGRVLGRIEATLTVICQRCLAPMDIGVVREVNLGLVGDDAEAAALDVARDPLVVGEEPMRLAELLEDELILAMPNFARHGPGECEMPPGADALEALDAGDESARAAAPGEDNPFAVLESLKSRKSP